ncbi:HET-domain-containing protein [Hypoxylon sp. FL1284]|nr:HET-domain-containing protein [Hypoxylon sp. FL1284]
MRKDTVLYYRKGDQPIYGHHRDRESFRRSALQGCVVCNDFASNDDHNSQEDHGFFSTFWVSDQSMNVEAGRGRKMALLVRLQKSLFIDDTLNYDLGCSTDSMQTWSMILDWMKTCSRLHSRCKKKAPGKGFMPTRLLEISKKQLSVSRKQLYFRLVSGSDCPKESPYVTLSYRWGTKLLEKSLRLLRSTVADLEQPTLTRSLPKTLRDAMQIADRFGVKYVWVDRLCIYQDSTRDWHREAGMVQDVYRNASFCISALGAADDEGGCFFPRDPALVAPTIINMSGEHGEEEVYRADLEDTAWCAEFQDQPLVQRAWVLQERLMSRRTIHFGSKQVFWECAEAHACETHPEGFGKFPFETESSSSRSTEVRQKNSEYPLWKQLIATPIAPGTMKDPHARIHASWGAVVSLYSDTKLTVASDKLVAVSGLAKDVRRALQSYKPGRYSYLAGLWEEVLIETLVWYVKVGDPAERVSNYRAPSWSWASLDGHVLMSDSVFQKTIKLSSLFSAHIKFASTDGDDTSEVRGGKLKIFGRTCFIEATFLSDNQYSANLFRQIQYPFTVEHKGSQGWQPGPKIIFDTTDDAREELCCIWIVAQPAAVGGWQASGLALSPWF